MAKEKLTTEQNLLMTGKTLEEKVAYLASLRDRGEITYSCYYELSNKYINREMRKGLPIKEKEVSCKTKTTTSTNMMVMIDKLQTSINRYIAYRNDLAKKLSLDAVVNYECVLGYYWEKSLIDRLLILGLRHPDERLPQIACRHIKAYRIGIASVDTDFWVELWSDPHFVPLDAVRMMLDEDEKRLYPCFKSAIKELKPYIEFQRNKEEKRLQFTEFEPSAVARMRQKARKTNRLESFNELLAAIEEE